MITEPFTTPRQHLGHSWKSVIGSNISFVCDRCGISGYLPAKEFEAGIKTNDDCDHYVCESVLHS